MRVTLESCWMRSTGKTIPRVASKQQQLPSRENAWCKSPPDRAAMDEFVIRPKHWSCPWLGSSFERCRASPNDETSNGGKLQSPLPHGGLQFFFPRPRVFSRDENLSFVSVTRRLAGSIQATREDNRQHPAWNSRLEKSTSYGTRSFARPSGRR